MSGTRLLPKLRDATSAMDFSNLSIDATVRGPDWDALWMDSRPLKICPPVWDCTFLEMRFNHDTLCVLSDSTPAQENFISTSCCSTMNWSRTTNVYKYGLVRIPWGFSPDMTWPEIEFSNSTLHTMVLIPFFLLRHNPPAPMAQASHYP